MADEDAGGFAAFMATVGGDKPKQAENKPKDEYHYEEEQEKEAMMKNYHHPMKQWFRQRPQLEVPRQVRRVPALLAGAQDVGPYREVHKAYIKFTEHGDDVEPSQKKENAADKEKQKEGPPTSEKAEEQPKKRRKSRWGDPVESAADGNGEKKRKKSRWAPASGASSTMTGLLNQKQQQTVMLRAQLENINQKLKTVAMDAALIEKDPNRSPSPPPQYDSNGKRTNTREVRMKAALEKRRRETIEELVTINPLFRPPADYARQKLHRKIYIPIRDFPSYNFIGLIIGPRGNTQKRMERETNCKIAIRGKGSVKEGSKGKKMNADENDDLHVLITGDREDDIDRAAKEVQSLLVPVDDTRNSHKQKQLRELALINGTLRDDDYVIFVAKRDTDNGSAPTETLIAVNVKCAICGDSSHPTRDCTQKKKSAEENAAIDKEYQQFMQQLGEAPVTSTATKETGPEAATTGAAAPWLQPAKTSSVATQPWMQQSVGAPAPPGTTTLGSTPATAFPPPVAPPGQYDYQAQGQDWGQQGWNGGYNSYYGSWDQSGQGADYQAYGTMVTCGAGAGAGAPGANGADQYQYPPYGNPPQ
ncbi:Splicing factor 1, helix-hairpin domain [Phytophthora cactorum]|nr:Splicing factor 1, helix-hairpin domain [Phytophthora cactorum]